MGIFSTRGMLRFAILFGKIETRKFVHHSAKAIPSTPPAKDSIRLSVRNWRSNRPRPTSKAAQAAISLMTH